MASANGEVCAEVVPDLGGIVSSLILPGPEGPRECLYRHPWFWDPHASETRGGIPLLFPICGRLFENGTPGLYHFDDQPFVLPIHGFAMRLPWMVLDSKQPDSLRLRLMDSAHTRTMYPFAFELDLLYSVSSTGFSCRLTVTNTGDRSLPYAAGFHPYFATPPAGAGKAQTTFEAFPESRWLYNENKTGVVDTAPPPSFPKSIADDDINGLLLEVGSQGNSCVRFPDGFELHLRATGETDPALFRYRQFYTRPDEPFFCDEPWMAPPGSLNRPGSARILEPGQSESGTIQITVVPP